MSMTGSVSGGSFSSKRERSCSSESFESFEDKGNKLVRRSSDSRDALFEVAPHLQEDTVDRIFSYIQQNQAEFLQQAKASERSVYIRPTASGVERALQFAPDGRIYIHLNRKKLGDRVLGEGNFKNVKLAFEITTEKVYASAGFKVPDFHDEVANTRIFQGNPGFSQIVETASYPYTQDQKEREGLELYTEKERVLFEFCNAGDLQQNLFTLESIERKQVFEDLVKAIAHMHRHGLIHRDLKLANIFLHREEEGALKIKVGDMSSLCRTSDLEKRKDFISTVSIVSPDLAKVAIDLVDEADESDSDSSFDPRRDSTIPQLGEVELAAIRTLVQQNTTLALDAWSLGCILHELLTQNKFPWSYTFNQREVLQEIRGLGDDWLPEPEDRNSPNYLVWRLLQVDPTRRLTLEEAETMLLSISWDSFIEENDLQAFSSYNSGDEGSVLSEGTEGSSADHY